MMFALIHHRCLHLLLELIGEEIYDEFDPQGAQGQLSSYIPQGQETSITSASAPVAIPAVISRTPSDSKLAGQYPGAVAMAHTRPFTPIVKPVALRGLSYLRPKSAPPIPRDQELNIGRNEETKDVPNLPTKFMNKIPRTRSELGLSGLAANGDNNVDPVPMEQPSLPATFPNEPEPAMDGNSKIPPSSLAAPVPSRAIPTSLLPAPTPRSTSPVPSLEAILLDRKRRLNAASGVGSGTSSSTASLPVVLPPATGIVSPDARQRTGTATNVKGMRFKSSPLGGDNKSGVVVAEKVKAEMGVREAEGISRP